MPSRTIIAGISFTDVSSVLAVLEHRQEEVGLLFLDEYNRDNDREEFWYLRPIVDFLDQHHTRIQQVNIALDGRGLVLLHCLLDDTLTQSERNEHLQWELSHYIGSYKPNEYINDVHILETDPQAHVQRVLAVAVRRNVIFGLQNFLSERKQALGIVDVNHFATASALIRNHPEVGGAMCASIGAHLSRVDVSILDNGHMVEYRYSSGSNEAMIRSFLGEVLDQFSVAGVYLHGTTLTHEQETMIKSLVKQPTAVLNPFRRLVVSHDFLTFDRYLKEPFRFAAAVGIALRTS